MLSIEKLREIDPELKDLSNEEIVKILASFYELGEIIWDDWLEQGHKNNTQNKAI